MLVWHVCRRFGMRQSTAATLIWSRAFSDQLTVPDILLSHLASRAFEVNQEPGFGRGLYATTRIPQGAVVHKEKPMLCHPAVENVGKVCYHCLKVLDDHTEHVPNQPINPRFCSVECKDRADTAYFATACKAGHFAALQQYCQEQGERFPLLAARLACQTIPQHTSTAPQPENDAGNAPKDIGFLCFANVGWPPPDAWAHSHDMLQQGLNLAQGSGPAHDPQQGENASGASPTSSSGGITAGQPSDASKQTATRLQEVPSMPSTHNTPTQSTGEGPPQSTGCCQHSHPSTAADQPQQPRQPSPSGASQGHELGGQDTAAAQHMHLPSPPAATAAAAAAAPQLPFPHLDLRWWVSILSRLHLNAFKVTAIMPVDWSNIRATLEAVDAGGPEGSSGTAIYLTASLLNHSCEPNLDVTFPRNDSLLVLRAARDIEAGEQLYISYIDTEMALHKRQEALRWAYGFRCRCVRCMEQLSEAERQ